MESTNATNQSISNTLLTNGDYYYFGDYDFSLNLDNVYKFLRQVDWNQRTVPLTVFVSIIMAVGTVGNCLVIAVFMGSSPEVSTSSSRTGGSRSTPLIVALAVADLLICVITMPGVIVRAWYLPWKWDALCKMWEMLRQTILPFSAMILVGIAYDRYCLICCPARSYSIKAYKRNLRIMLGGSCLLGLAFGVPPMLAVGVYQASDSGVNSTDIQYIGLCEVNSLIISDKELSVYWLVLVAFFWVVLALLLLMYTAILLSVWRQAKLWNQRRRVLPLKSSDNTRQDSSSKLATASRPMALTHKADSSSKYCTSNEVGEEPKVEGKTCTTDLPNSPNLDTSPTNHGEDGMFFVKVASFKQPQQRPLSVFVKRTQTLELVIRQPEEKPGPGLETVLQSCNSTTSDTENICSALNHKPDPKTAQAALDRAHEHLQPNHIQNCQLQSTTAESQQPTQSSQQTNNRPQTTKQSLSRKPPCRAHTKTAIVFFLITATFLVSYIPTFLMVMDLIPDHPVFFYSYFIHTAANPLLYSATNKKFRSSARQLFNCRQ